MSRGRTTRAGRIASALTISAFAWTVLVGVLLLLVPVGSSGTSTVLSDGTVIEETSRETLMEGEGAGVMLLLAVPVVLAIVGLAGSRSLRARDLRFVTGALLFAGCMIAAASLGMFYVPAAITLIAAGATTPPHGPFPNSDEDHS